jgi:hypothetical protein
MILVRRFVDGEERLVSEDGDGVLKTHAANDDCFTYGCVVHNPTRDSVMAGFPLNWREDRGIMERICPHGVGHPDFDSANYNIRAGAARLNSHGCDGCCSEKKED